MHVDVYLIMSLKKANKKSTFPLRYFVKRYEEDLSPYSKKRDC